MLELNDEDEHLPSLSEFYEGESVFLTGAAGFVGTVLLETLLRCFPGIKFIYILLRFKKNMEPEIRKEKIFEKKVFEKLKEETPELLKKVRVIAGDASLPNLGMREEDIKLLIDEVSIVFHCAAVINFTKPLKFMLISNVLSLNCIIELCKKMRKYKALVYTSTAYCNCNHPNTIMKEEVYRLLFPAEQFLAALKNEDLVKLQEMVDCCKPDWPNLYTFSKCLAENVIADTASDLSVAIIRPSQVYCTWKRPIPGYIEENSGLAALSIGNLKGFVKVLNADPNVNLNLVPADIVANSHVIAAWGVGAKRCSSPLVVNCTATNNLVIKLEEFSKVGSELGFKFLLPRSFDRFSILCIVPNRYMYYIVAAYKHYLPAIVLDGVLKVLGKKPRLFSLYCFFDTVMKSLNFFLAHSLEFEIKNLEYLDKLVAAEDRKDLTLDFKNASFADMSFTIPASSPFYDWKIDNKTQSERRNVVYRRHLIITGIQWMFLFACCLVLYWLCSIFL